MKRAGAEVGGWAVINSRRNIQSLGPSKCPWLSGPPTPTALSLAETHLIPKVPPGRKTSGSGFASGSLPRDAQSRYTSQVGLEDS